MLATFFAEYKLKLIIGAIVIAGVGAAYWSYTSRGEEIKTLEANAAVSTIAIGSLENTVVDQKGSAEIKEVINTAVVKDAEKITTRHDKISEKRKDKVQSIEKLFDELPKTQENIDERDTQTSVAMIDGLWDTYCSGMPDDPGCSQAI
jgi:hypothetical protein